MQFEFLGVSENILLNNLLQYVTVRKYLVEAKLVAIIPRLLHQSQTNQVPSPAEDGL